MELNILFLVESILLGIGLAMDAFSVSMANGLNEPKMGKGHVFTIAGVFAVFQAIMPLIGWVCVHTVLKYFQSFQIVIPWIAIALLGYIGGKMLYEGIKCSNSKDCECKSRLTFRMLIVQGVATSIDALSVGFTIADYNAAKAIICALLIASVTFIICVAGVYIGKVFGTKISGKASILGGVILIAIGIEIFLTGVL